MATIRDFPGIEVEERPWNGSQDARTFAAEPGPGNARVPPGGSPEAQAFRSAQAADIGPPRPTNLRTGGPSFSDKWVGSNQQWNQFGDELGARATRTAEAVKQSINNPNNFVPTEGGAAGRLLTKGMRVLGPAAGLAEAAGGYYEGDKARMGMGALDTGAALALGTPLAPIAGTYLAARGGWGLGQMAGDAINSRLSDDTKNTIGGTVNTMLRRIGLGENDDAMRSDQAAVRTGLRSPVTGAIPKLDNSVLPGTHDLPSVSDGPNATDQRLAAGLQVPNGQDASYVRFGNQQGKTIAGLDDNDVRKFKTADGRTIYSNVRGDNAQMMSPAGMISAQNSAAADALASRYASQGQARGGLRAGMPDEPNLPAGYGAHIPGVNAPASQYETELAARNASVQSNLVPPKVSFRETARLANQKEIASDQNATTRRGQDINADVTREGHKVNMRGQDITAATAVRGQDSTARTAAMQARVEQFNKDRTYAFDREKHGDDLAKQRMEMRQSAQKAMHERITSMLPPGADGKPDTEAAARYMTGLNGILAQHEETLRSKAAAGDKGAEAALDDLSRNGVGALPESMVRKHIQGMKFNELSQQYGSSRFNPVGGTAVITDTPPAGMRLKKNFILPNEYEALDARGNPTGATVPARAIEGDGSWIGGQRRVDMRDFSR